jgi:hypothetical protein
MLKVRSLVGVAAGLIAIPLMGSPAWSVPCVSGTETSYEALGATGCTVGPLTFFGISIDLKSLNGGVIGALTIDPFDLIPGEFGLKLTYISDAGEGRTDLAMTMGIAGPPAIVDAFASLTGSGDIRLDEQILNGLTGDVLGEIHLTGTDSTTIFFPPTLQILAMKDQANLAGGTSSILINAYSVVPGPIVGAGLPGIVAACGGLLALARRRRRQIA